MLTQKQENFCLKYVECANASESYRHAYSSENMKPETVANNAYVLMQNSEILTRIQELKDMAVSDVVMTRQEALERLSAIARSSITDIAEFRESQVGEDENGEPVLMTTWRIKNSDEIDSKSSLIVKSVTATKFGPKLEVHDQMSAIQQLSKMQGWEAAQKYDHTSSDGTMTPKDTSAAVLDALKRKHGTES